MATLHNIFGASPNKRKNEEELRQLKNKSRKGIKIQSGERRKDKKGSRKENKEVSQLTASGLSAPHAV